MKLYSSGNNAKRIKGVWIDDTDIADGKLLKYNATSGNLEYETETGGSGSVTATPAEDSTDAISSGWAYDHENSGMTSGTAHVPDNTSAADGSFLAKDGTWQVPAGTGSGEANNGINIGTAGVGIFDSKSGVNLQFKKLKAGSTKVTISASENDEVEVDVDTSNFGLAAVDISDFDTEVSSNTDVAANTAARHDAVSVTDSSEIDFTLTGQDITASIKAGSIDETKLDTSVNASLDLADSALQAADIADKADKSNVLELDNTAEFTPDADYEPATKKYVDDNIPSVPVDSVNGETGVVVLDADDISDTATTNKFTTQTDIDRLANTSGTNTGDEVQATIKTKLGAASTTTDGYLTSTDWNTFNGKSDFDGTYGSLTGTPDLTLKADKVTTPTAGNFAALDASGNLTDSGHKDADYADAVHTHTASDITDFDTEVSNNTTVTGKADKVGTPTENNLIKQDSSGNNADAGVAVNDSGTTTADLWTGSKITSELSDKEDTLSSDQKRTITVGTAAPSGGSDGDIYIKYTA